MTKRRKSQGRPRGTIEELPSGSLRVSIYAGTDPITKRRYDLRETIPYDHPDRGREAERTLTRFRAQVDEKRHPRTRATLGQLLDKYYDVLDDDPSTMNRTEECIRLHIRPLLGDVPVAKIDGEIIDSFIAELRRCRVHCKRGKKQIDHRTTRPHTCDERCRPHVCNGLAKATVRKCYWILSGAFEKARVWKWVNQNHVRDVKPPAPPPSNPEPPSAAEAARLLNEAWKNPTLDWGMLVWLTMTTGVRCGELCGLRWKHIDLDTGVIRLSKAIGRLDSSGSTIYEKDPKTHQRRHIVVDEHSTDLLRAYRHNCRTIAQALGVEPTDEAYVFSLEPDRSKPWKPSSVSQRYRRMAAQLGIKTSIHKLRHYSATELIAAGVDVRTVAGRLGHSGGGTTTLKVYTAFVNEADQRAAKDLFSRLPKPPVEINGSGTLEPTPTGPPRIRGPYEQIAADLRGAIKCGALQPGDSLPTVTELATRYDVAASTAHRAVAVLRGAGEVSVSRGQRAIVALQEGAG